MFSNSTSYPNGTGF